MPEIVTTSLSFFEAEIEFVQPNIKIWLDRAAIVEAVYTALSRWNITVDDIDVITIGKPSEQGVKFRIPEKRASFFFGAGVCRFNRDSTNWDTAPETIAILDAALTAFHQHSNTKVKTFKTAVALHVQPNTRKFIDLVTPLIPPPMAALYKEPAESMAAIVKWPHHRVTVDGSAQVANGLFIRYERDFPADTDYETMAKQLHADELAVFAMLDIAEE
jgi:hypothetical protein